MQWKHLVTMSTIMVCAWLIMAIVLLHSPEPRELHQAQDEPGEAGMATSTSLGSSVPDSSSERREILPARAIVPTQAQPPLASDSPSMPPEQDLSFQDPKQWIKTDHAYDYCVLQKNGPWILIPKDATEHQVMMFKFLLRDHLVRYERQKNDLYSRDDVFSAEWQRIARQYDLDAQENFARCFQQVWPTARQPDPVVR